MTTESEVNKEVVDKVFSYIDRMDDPIETAEYMADLLDKFSGEVTPLLLEILELRGL